ncbi:MAG: M24 family metallopeptidase [Halioglobus sp.]
MAGADMEEQSKRMDTICAKTVAGKTVAGKTVAAKTVAAKTVAAKTVAERLASLREVMAAEGFDALFVPRADEYLGEYIPPHNERLRWISGFTGSAGVAVILRQSAAIFVDGRYTVQVQRQVDPGLFEYRHLTEEPHVDWLASQLQGGARVACDPRLHSLAWFRDAAATLARAGIELVADSANFVDRCWQDRPAAQVSPALLLPERYSGESSSRKRERIGREVAALGADAALVFAPDSVSWLLNVRGTDVPRLPVLQSFALLRADGSLMLFVDSGRIPEGFSEHVGKGVTVRPETDASAAFAAFSGSRVLADPRGANAWTQLALEQSGATLVPGQDPVLIPKACKNGVEIEGSRRAHIRDAVAEVRFLCWLDGEVAAGRLHDEATLADKLLSLRAGGEFFQDLSFDTISAAGANAAMAHYNHLNGDPATLQMDSVYLVDSGGHYLDGTTDITRTVAIGDPGEALRQHFTLVLKGHIALDRARFPRGTTGTQLDVLARQFLWGEGLDYDHGTGHGVGVFLSVHEGPQRIAKQHGGAALRPGMIVSNEPGYYRDGGYGIRCENLLVVRESDRDADETPMLEFEALTLVPFDRRLLQPRLLTVAEIAWLDAYHRRVAETVGPLLAGPERQWLLEATRPLDCAGGV